MLPNQRPPKQQAFTDGVIEIVREVDVSLPGEIPNMQYTVIERLPFRRRTIGYRRRESAFNAGAGIDYMLECSERRTVHVNDFAHLVANDMDADSWYKIETIEWLEETTPAVMRLTLSRTAQIIELVEDGTV